MDLCARGVFLLVLLQRAAAFQAPRARPTAAARARVVVSGGSILPPKLREYGAFGLIAYSAVELVWWGAPFCLAARSAGGFPTAETLDAFADAAKAPFLGAVLLWPNSWLRNGAAARGAAILRDAASGGGRG